MSLLTSVNNPEISTSKRRREGNPDDIERSLKRIYQENKEIGSSSSSPPSSSCPSSSLSRNWIYDVFPSFRGEDVRKNILSHIMKEFRRKPITPFIDNEIKRGESIGPEIINAIRGSKIAIVLLSRNYASSKWCLDELVEIMKCRKELGQTVLTIFYEVEPTDVKKLTGHFGDVFRITCEGRSKEETERWRKALEEVATIAGYDSNSNKWDNEADMIEEIANDVLSKLTVSAPSSDFDDLVGMRAHMEKMERLLCLESNGVRMIGIWGPSGIGKSTIARVLFVKYSPEFQLSVFMDNVKRICPRPCHDEYTAKLQLQTKMLSQIINLKDNKIEHLGVVKDRLKDKRVLVVLDDVDQLMQLHAMAKETWWFGPGSWIIITTQDKGVLIRHGIERIYEVGFPDYDDALQIFCMSAFGQKFPEDGFEDLAREVTWRAGNLPLGLKIMGSHFRGLSKHQWEMELSRLWSSLDGEIESILKYSYDALCDEDKDLFVYIACFFDGQFDDRVEALLAKNFSSVRRGLQVLAEKSLISLRKWNDESNTIVMHELLVRFGREIDRRQSNGDCGQLKFLVNANETCQVLSDYTQGSINARGMRCVYSQIVEDELYKNEKVLERLSNLQFLDVRYTYRRGHLRESLIYLPPRLKLLCWYNFPMTRLLSNFNPEFLIEITMYKSELEKLWEGNQTITNLKFMNLRNSSNLKELPDLSTASNLQKLILNGCSSLVKLPSSIGNATNLKELDLRGCLSLLKLPSSIGNATSLKKLDLCGCSSLVELSSSIGNATNLQDLDICGCSSLVELPSSMGNTTNLWKLNLRGCSSLVKLPSFIGNVTNLKKLNLGGCSSLVKLPSFIGSATNLNRLSLYDCSSLVELPSSIGNATNLKELCLNGCSSLVKLPSFIGNPTNFKELDLSDCSSLVKLPSSIGNATNLEELNLRGCSSLVELPSSIGNLHKLQRLFLDNCSNLETLPVNVNMKSLEQLSLNYCPLLKTFPKISMNIVSLLLRGTAIEAIPSSIRSWCRLRHFAVPYCENLGKSLHAFDLITELDVWDTRVRELAPWIKEMSRLERLVISGCTELVTLPQLPDSLRLLDAENCESLESLDSSFYNAKLSYANFGNCFELNQEARNLIMRTCREALLPGEEVPTCFHWRATGSSLSMKWNGTDTEKTIFKACVLLVNDGDVEFGDRKLGYRKMLSVGCRIKDKQNDTIVSEYSTISRKTFWELFPLLDKHFHTFEIEEEVSCRELVFEFEVSDEKWEIRECGLGLVPKL